MPQSFSRIITHLVFSTKDRVPFLKSELRPKMHAYLAGTLRELNCPVVDVGGVSDHVHILFQLSRTLSVAETVSRVKGSSSKWFKADCPRFYWQEGYGTFSVGLEGLQAAIRYVKSQEEHHRKMSFQDEFRGFLVENEMDWDERYVWD